MAIGNLVLKKVEVIVVNWRFMFSISLGKVEVLSPKLLLTFPRPAKSFTVKENTIGSVVREILYRTKTDRHPVTFMYPNVWLLYFL